MNTEPDARLIPNGYMPRIVDAQVEGFLDTFGAVEVSGTKWCGKTWTSLAHAASVSYIDEDLELAETDPKLMLIGEKPHVIDEWQLVPPIWDEVRRAVDKEHGLRGNWILTGSSSPRLRGRSKQANAPRHSGAGRIGRIRMFPMTLSESGDSISKISLQGLFDGRFEEQKSDASVEKLVEVACRGGWPEAIEMDSEMAQRVVREYLRILFEESVPDQGLNGDTARRLCASIARNLGASATYKTFKLDMYGAEDDPDEFVSDGTIAAYIDLLKRMYVIEEIPGWAPASRSRKRMATKPKRYFADPSMAVAMLGMSESAMYSDWQTFGLVFENLCMRDLLVYAYNLDNIGFSPVRYYRDDSGLECNAIIELADGRWAAIEIKVSDSKVPQAIKGLKRLRKKIVSDNPQARVDPPVFMAVITGSSDYAYEAEEGIYVFPIQALTA